MKGEEDKHSIKLLYYHIEVCKSLGSTLKELFKVLGEYRIPKQSADETLDVYVDVLRTLALTCYFGEIIDLGLSYVCKDKALDMHYNTRWSCGVSFFANGTSLYEVYNAFN